MGDEPGARPPPPDVGADDIVGAISETVVGLGGGPPVVEKPVPGKIVDETDVRAKLAFILAAIFGGTILISLILLASFVFFKTQLSGQTDQFKPVQDFVANLMSAEVGLFGTVLGFYFAGRGGSGANK